MGWVQVCVYALSLLLVAGAEITENLVCPFGKRLSTCNTNCAPVCNGEPVCPAGCFEDGPACETCVSGCFCDSGLMEFGDICVPPDLCVPVDPANIPPIDQCSQYGSCDECISSDPDCQWCPFEPDEISVIGSRCRLRGSNPLCPEEIIDPQPTLNIEAADNREFGDDVQIRPQKLRLALRQGEPKSFTLQFRPAENFPLDVYLLLDVTGSFSISFRETVPDLATQLLEALQNISDRYAVAFGGFGEKRAVPYALPSPDENTYQQIVDLRPVCNSLGIDLEDCNPTISFRHTANFSRVETGQLRDVLSNISIHLNLDSLEGGLDGVVQVLTCREEIGWRDPSLRMLLYMSNAPYHLAGDGKVGAVLEPNPGRCSLVPGTEDNVTFNEYLDDIHYDYPSVYQLRELLRSTETNIVFAVTEGVAQPYRDLQEELGSFARQTILERNSENLVSVIQEAYNEISQEIQLFPRETYEGLEFEFTPGEGCNSDDVDVCTGVSIGKNVSFDVTVTMTSCLEGNMTAFLQSPAFGTVELEIVPLCECPCKNEVMENAEVCNNGTGDLICGQCECPPGMSGDKCQCPVAVTPICGPEGGLECSGAGRGRCNCGDCMCFVQEELLRTRGIVEPYFGDYCQCDHFTSCAGSLTDDGTLCFGRGECDCDTDMCMCMEEEPTTGVVYGGPLCDCDPKKCYSEEHNMVCVLLDSTVVNLGRQACNPCTGCRCTPPTIKTSNSTCETVCVFNEPCARCIKNLQDASTDCMSCNPRLFRLFTGSSQPDDTERCSFTDGDGCSHAFFVTLSMEVLVDDERDCPATGGVGNLAWIIPVAVVAGLLVLGFIILLIVLLIVCINDRREYHRFKRDLEDANWDQQENPMYVSPSQQYSNITYRPKKEPIKED